MNTKDLRKKRSEELKKIRKAKRVSITELHKMSGLGRDTISNLENGDNSWNADTEIIYLETLRLIV